MSANTFSKILFEIASKTDWYNKVFDDTIVDKWRDEVLNDHPKDENEFWMSIRFLRTTAQGCLHLSDCEWSDFEPCCKSCKEALSKNIRSSNDKIDDKEIENYIYEYGGDYCDHPICKCTPPDCKLSDYVDYRDGTCLFVLLTQIRIMSNNEIVDWHPNSKKQVRDIIHPSLYCYVKGVSELINGTVEGEVPEDIRYAWLPSDFSIEKDKVKTLSYINNLDEVKYPYLLEEIEKSFFEFIPRLEKVLKREIKNNIQVIVKVASIHLTKENPEYDGGSWHIEGMPYEHIAATCIHYLKTEGITDSFLEFRKPVVMAKDPDMDYPQNDTKFTTYHFGIEKDSHHDGTMNRYLGMIKCDEGSSVVFPNTLQHRVKGFKLKDGYEKGTRIIIAFFVIDPDHRIISTSDVPKQYNKVTLEQAHLDRERLMFHRTFFSDKLNDKVFKREYSLCEH